MSKFPYKPDIVIQMIKNLSNKLDLDFLEKILTIAPTEEVQNKLLLQETNTLKAFVGEIDKVNKAE